MGYMETDTADTEDTIELPLTDIRDLRAQVESLCALMDGLTYVFSFPCPLDQQIAKLDNTIQELCSRDKRKSDAIPAVAKASQGKDKNARRVL